MVGQRQDISYSNPKEGRLKSVHEQIRELIEDGQGIPESWGRPTENQSQALREGGGNIPAQIDFRKMDGGVPVSKER